MALAADSPPQGYLSEKTTMHSHAFAKFPPKVKLLGGHSYLKDINCRLYSRDIGRSSIVGGQIFFQFGDTFCKDGDGEFCGLIPNTIAHLPDKSKADRTCYQRIHPDGKVTHFLPLTVEEKQWEEGHGHESGGSRIVIWSFGGIVEEVEGSGKGWCWYQKGIERKEGQPTFCGAGIARVELDRTDQSLKAHRTDRLLFPADSISWGTFSVIRHNSHFYLYGCDHTDKTYLARCPIYFPEKADSYTFWNGSEYVSDATQAKPIWTKLQQGAIIRTRMFDPSHRANFMFVGCNAWADSKIQIATAPAPEGPWSEFIPVGPVPGIEYTEGYRYCVYPHPWMGTAGVMGVSWSEHWPGGVILGRLEFELEEQRGKVEGEGEYAAPPVETRGQSQKLFFCC